MKTSGIIAALGIVACAQAQQQCTALTSKIPTCALACFEKASATAGCTNPLDLACQCQKAEAIAAQANPCVAKSCSASEGQEAESVAKSICTCVEGAGKPASSSSAAAAQSSTTTTSSSKASSPPYPKVGQIGDGQVQAGTAAPTGTKAAAPSASATPFKGAGVRPEASVVGVMVAIVAAMAAYWA